MRNAEIDKMFDEGFTLEDVIEMAKARDKERQEAAKKNMKTREIATLRENAIDAFITYTKKLMPSMTDKEIEDTKVEMRKQYLEAEQIFTVMEQLKGAVGKDWNVSVTRPDTPNSKAKTDDEILAEFKNRLKF